MFVQVAVNGSRTRADHHRVPLSAEDIAADAVACSEAGAAALHIHPRDVSGRETLEGTVVEQVCKAIRRRTSLPIGLTTELSIAGSPARRMQLVRQWSTLPDYVTVNVAEAGWDELARWALDQGMGVEAGVWTVSDVRRLALSGLDGALTRILVEPIDQSRTTALATIEHLHQALDLCELRSPRLQHTEDDSGWTVVADALKRGLQTRVGLEDMLTLPDGTRVESNADLVTFALHNDLTV
ncbi:3-keto-5-aminohexanoate cleavage protein [Microbacterium marinilacus]|uniref:3-keto-5-aminohexanoate cleavage protein n=1 Tax=Microbacterium marinilacus TaxID=415209 RepID=A0ABP7BEI4_9MICO|nr:3-keto-5-aminohexanoate cleavage protein [Microbacterium marinilacus]MBY0690514.1 3-keto-5-aminohexanoate cleavage protein [Microbacterium marinilacus]